MARISKDPDERRLELIDAAERLFNQKGFESTAVSDIVKSIGVAQGTFYYYFKSKDDIFNAIVERFMEELMSELKEVQYNEKLNTKQKLEIILDKSFSFMENNEGVIFYLHTKDNAELHERIEKKFIEYATPLAVEIVKQGIKEKLFSVDYPEEVVGFIMAGSHYIGDVNVFFEERESYFRKVRAVEFFIERVLGVDKETMEYFGKKCFDRLNKLKL